jgi:FAD/FMN-containing dehydrogenase
MSSQSQAVTGNAQKKLRRRRWLTVAVFLVSFGLIWVARPAWHLWNAVRTDLEDRQPTPAGFVDDASALNETAVHEVWQVPEDTAVAETQLRDLLQRARDDKLRVSIAGARHSMGGHTIAPDGIVVDMRTLNAMSLDEQTNILTVGAGAIWHDILAYLDPRGRSIQVMQSNDSFSVGGSISVNCHGWQHGKPPIASTVRSFRLMKSDGTVVACSRDENSELFSLVLGGYGLFGIILDVQLTVIPNARYRIERIVVPAGRAMETYHRRMTQEQHPPMIYARMDVSKDNFLNEVLLYVLTEDPPEDGVLAPIAPAGMVSLRRSIFRGSADSDYGKRLRWNAETKFNQPISAKHYTRNQMMDEGVEVFQNRSDATTDILHEYFVPANRLADLVVAMQRIIPSSDANLLNVTIRSVEEDPDTFLRYADQAMLSAVMLFEQPRTSAGDDQMRQLTQRLIDAVLSLGGRHYLPYRLHATQQQFDRAYPQAKQFFALKRQHDPEELFVNLFYLRYGGSDVVSKTD